MLRDKLIYNIFTWIVGLNFITVILAIPFAMSDGELPKYSIVILSSVVYLWGFPFSLFTNKYPIWFEATGWFMAVLGITLQLIHDFIYALIITAVYRKLKKEKK